MDWIESNHGTLSNATEHHMILSQQEKPCSMSVLMLHSGSHGSYGLVLVSKLWPSSGITVYPIKYYELKSDIAEIQAHLNAMRAVNPTWGRSLLTMNNNGGQEKNN
jgi:hypothetical protein